MYTTTQMINNILCQTKSVLKLKQHRNIIKSNFNWVHILFIGNIKIFVYKINFNEKLKYTTN